MVGVRLVHLFGYVFCDTIHSTNWSPWGCGVHVNAAINVVVTRENQFVTNSGGKWHRIPGYNSMSPELELKVFSTPIPVTDEKPALTSTSCVRLHGKTSAQRLLEDYVLLIDYMLLSKDNR